MLSNCITKLFVGSLKIDCPNMCKAYSYSHRCPSRSHLKLLELENSLLNLHFYYYNIATYITLNFYANNHKGFGYSHPLAICVTNYKHKKKHYYA